MHLADNESTSDVSDEPFNKNRVGFPRLLSIAPGEYSTRSVCAFLEQKLLLEWYNLLDNSGKEVPDPTQLLFRVSVKGEDDTDEIHIEDNQIVILEIFWQEEMLNMYFDLERENTFHQGYGFTSDPSPTTLSLQDCFREHLKVEEVDEVYCSKCKSHQSATKKLDLFILPKILVIHLKRFVQHPRTFRWSKRNINVLYPLQTDFGLFCVSNGQKKYELFATSNHHGGHGIDSGHYTACCKRKDEWFKFDDEHFFKFDESHAQTSDGYLLFYRQC